MTTDVRTLLHDAADAPSRPPDLDRARRSARDRRRRRRGVGALAAIVVLALVTGFVALGGGDGGNARVAIGPRQTGSEIPDGWKTIHADPGITISIPPDWKTSSPSTTPVGVPVLSMDDLPADAGDILSACTMGQGAASLPEDAGSLVNIWEYAGDATEVPDANNEMLGVVDRPETFVGALARGAPIVGAPCPGARYDQLAFRAAGRVFMVRVVTIFPTAAVEETRLALTGRVLDTLRVEPLSTEATTTTGPPPSATVSPTVVTTAPPFEPTTQDERDIASLVSRWLTYQSDDEIRATIVDADSILDAMHEGMRQYESNLSGYSGRADSVHLTDDTHADVVFTLFLNGGVLYSNQHGAAVKVDGRWMMTRGSECALLSLGGITCPSA